MHRMRFRSIQVFCALAFMLVAALAVPAQAFAVDGVTYLDAQGNEKTQDGVTEVTPSDTSWGAAGGAERWYVVQGDVTIDQRVPVKGDVHLILADGASLTVNGGIDVGEDNSLSIYGQQGGTGKLVADGQPRYDSAGIGSGLWEPCGTVTIAGGVVVAEGGSDSAGIGGGSGGAGGIVTITGGTVTATGGSYGGAGIGGGYHGSGDTVTIAGGTVTATGGSFGGAGIGGGSGGAGGAVGITGGVVTAKGSAGIGGGDYASAGTVTISGGFVDATGGSRGAGIGTGEFGSGAIVTITGGTVTATSDGGAGIGAGKDGSGGTFSTGEGGHAAIVASSISDQSNKGSWSGIIFEGDTGRVYGDEVALAENVAVPEDSTLTIPEGSTLGIPEDVTLTISSGATLAVSEGATVRNAGIITGAGAISGEGSLLLVDDGSVSAATCTVSMYATGVAYIDEKGEPKKTAEDVRVAVVGSSTTTLTDGWYVAKGSITLNQRVTVSGKVHLILADGATLTVNGGINVDKGNALSIYGQEQGAGKLIATASSDLHPGIGGDSGMGRDGSCGDVAIAGGVVIAKGGQEAAGIGGGAVGSGGAVTITGGAVNATGGHYGAGIGGGYGGLGGSVTITGGSVIAEGGESGAGIGDGCEGQGGTITIAGGTVTATGGFGGAGIGGGDSGSGGTVIIDGGSITATGGDHSAGIGSGAGGYGGDITITGGTVTAMGDKTGAGIGDGKRGSGGTFSTGEGGHAVIFASSESGAAISDQSGNGSWSGVIFEGNAGKVYGASVILTEDVTVPEGSTLEVPSGTALTIGEGVTVTVSKGATVNNSGSIEGEGSLEGDGAQYLRGDGSIADTVACALNTVRVLASVEYVGMDGKPAKTAEDVEVLAVSSSMTAWGADDDAEHWCVAQGEVNIDKRVTVTGDVHLILVDGAKLTVDGGISVNEDNALSIYGQEEGAGKLVANGSFSNAGIGGSASYNSGTIKIAGGAVAATGGEDGAGIGGGYNGSSGAITIVGGTVDATGGNNGAGIGGGSSFGQGDIVTISGGTVTATGGDDSAGIGGGSGGAGGTVDITGGTVVATGGSFGAGIGGGSHGSGGTVTISGGTVTATGGDNSAGIGGGQFSAGGTVDITGGTVTAKGNSSGSGIGGSDTASAGTVTISGGTVDATGGSSGAGIGGGYSCSDGTVTISGGAIIATGKNGSGIGAGEGGRNVTFSTGTDGHAVILASGGNGGTAISDQSGKGGWSGVIFEGNSGKVYGSNVTPTEDFTIPADHQLVVGEGTGLTITKGITMTNEGSVTLQNDSTFANNGTLINKGTFTVITGADASGNGTITGNITKADQPAANDVAATNVSADALTIKATVDGAHGKVAYALVEGEGSAPEASDEAWQESGRFTNLSAGKRYTAYVRYAGTDYYKAAVSDGVAVWTAQGAPAKGTGYTIDYAAETAQAAKGYELKTTDGTWTTKAIDIKPGGKLVVRAAAIEGGAPASAETKNVLAESPTLTISDASASRNGDTVAVNVETNELDGATLEYKFSGMEWQDGNTVTIADGGSVLMVTVRIAATDSSFASEPQGLHFGGIDFSTSSATYKGAALSVSDLVSAAYSGPHKVDLSQDLSFSYVPCNAEGVPTGESISGTPADAGTYLVTATLAKKVDGDKTYAVYYAYAETVQVTIEPKELTVGVKDTQVAYGSPAPTIQDATLTGMDWVGADADSEKAKELEGALRDGLSLSWVSDEGEYSTSAAAGSTFAARLERKGFSDALANYRVEVDSKNLGTLTVAKSDSSSMTLAVKDEAGADQTRFTYGDAITVKATVAPAASNALARAAAQPDAADAQLSCCDTVLVEHADEAALNQDGSYTFTFTYTTANKQIPVGPQELTVSFAGDDSLHPASASASITLAPKRLTASVAAGAQKAYDGTATFSNVALELDGVLPSDDVSFTASGAAAQVGAGEGLAFTAATVTAAGNDASFYALDPGDVTGTVTITPVALSDSWFTVAGDGLAYTGQALTPPVLTTDGAPGYLPETAGAAWTVSYENNTNAGAAEAVVSGQGNFIGTVRLPFAIARAAVQVVVTMPNVHYTGNPVDAEQVAVEARDDRGNASDGAVTLAWYAADSNGGWTPLATAPTEVGSYRVVASMAQGANHEAGTGSADFQILKQDGVLIKLGTIDSKPYDGIPLANPQVLDLGGYDGGIGAVTFTWYDADGKELSAAPTDAGTYTVRASAPATSTQEAPTFSLPAQTVTIYQAAQSLAADQVFAAAESVAGASNGSISVFGLAEGAAWEWRRAGGDAWAAGAGTSLSGVAPGTYEVRLAGSANYAASAPVAATVQSFADTHGGITFPAGSTDTGSGTVALPEGGGAVTLPGGGGASLPGGTVVDPGAGTATLPEAGGSVSAGGGSSIGLPGGSTVDLGDGVATLPEQGGAVALPGGSTVTVPGGSAVDLPAGTVAAPDGTTVASGGDGALNVTFPDGETVKVPSGSTLGGSGVVTTPDGSVAKPNGSGGISVTLPDGTKLTAPSGSTVSADGTVLDPDGTVIKPASPEEKPEEEPEEGPEEEPEEKPEEDPEENPEDQPNEHPEDRPNGDPEGQPVENPGDQPDENPVEHPDENSEGNPADQPAENPGSQQAESSDAATLAGTGDSSLLAASAAGIVAVLMTCAGGLLRRRSRR